MTDILNLGCGHKKIEGALNVDEDPSVNPDLVYDLNKIPFEFAKDNQYNTIYMFHILEHLDHVLKSSNLINEIIRISKNGAKVIVKVPHKSGCAGYDDVGHITFFTAGTMRMINLMNDKFKIKKIRLNYFIKDGDKRIWYKVANKVVSFFSNCLGWYSIRFCERIWCYWVGGFDEVYVEFEIAKDSAKKKLIEFYVNDPKTNLKKKVSFMARG